MSNSSLAPRSTARVATTLGSAGLDHRASPFRAVRFSSQRWVVARGTLTLPHARMCRSGRSNRSKHGRPPAPAEEHAEPRPAASSVGAADRARWGAEQRARTTVVATLVAAQNGTSGAVADGKHARRWATLPPPRTGDQGYRRQGPTTHGTTPEVPTSMLWRRALDRGRPARQAAGCNRCRWSQTPQRSLRHRLGGRPESDRQPLRASPQAA